MQLANECSLFFSYCFFVFFLFCLFFVFKSVSKLTGLEIDFTERLANCPCKLLIFGYEN